VRGLDRAGDPSLGPRPECAGSWSPFPLESAGIHRDVGGAVAAPLERGASTGVAHKSVCENLA
jgi:hypothetical protein